MAEDADRETETFRFDPEDRTDDPSDSPGETDRHGEKPRGEAREFGWRGWVLVGMILFAFLVIPLAIYYIPRAQGVLTSFGLGYRDAYLVLPLVPALLLGAMAVWATTRP